MNFQTNDSKETEEDKDDEAKDDEPTKKLTKGEKVRKKTNSPETMKKHQDSYDRYWVDGPEDKLEKGLWKCLRIMFEEPLSTDSIWSEIEQQKIVSWRYYDTSRVHCLNLESMDVYLLSDRKYPLPAEVCKTMLKMKLLDGKMNEDCYRLLKMMEKKQAWLLEYNEMCRVESLG
ncbi:hypothetical protein Tco_0621824 [Tanacetum coccineum]